MAPRRCGNVSGVTVSSAATAAKCGGVQVPRRRGRYDSVNSRVVAAPEPRHRGAVVGDNGKAPWPRRPRGVAVASLLLRQGVM